MTLLIVEFGWRESFYLLAPIGIAAGAWWWWYGRDEPSQHRAITAAEIEAHQRRPATRPAPGQSTSWRAVLRNRNILLLACSYFCMNYTFYIFSNWLFTYLVEERGFSLLESGLLYALPFVVGAVLAAVGGVVCDALCRRIGPRLGLPPAGHRGPGDGGLAAAGRRRCPKPLRRRCPARALLRIHSVHGGRLLRRPRPSPARPTRPPHMGSLNTGGNLAGFLAPVVGLIVDRLGWWSALATGSAFALLGAVLWLFVRADQTVAPQSGENQP